MQMQQRQVWIRRSRVWYAVAIVIMIVVGLATRHTSLLPPLLAKVAGDALWALCAFLAIGWLAPAAPPRSVAVAALVFAYAIEFSQLYHAPWIDTLRHFRLGALVLGSNFAWADLAYYTMGIGAGWLAETRLLTRTKQSGAGTGIPTARPEPQEEAGNQS